MLHQGQISSLGHTARTLAFAASLATLAACIGPIPEGAAPVPPEPTYFSPTQPNAGQPRETYETAQYTPYSRREVLHESTEFFGATTEGLATVVERILDDLGKPNAYIAGEEGGGAIILGLRYGRGLLYRKGFDPVEVYWQGPSIGFDFGGNASRVFALIYRLDDLEQIYQRFPSVEGSYYFIAGLGVNYQQNDGVIFAPIRTGAGLRAGVNAGYTHYTKESHINPF